MGVPSPAPPAFPRQLCVLLTILSPGTFTGFPGHIAGRTINKHLSVLPPHLIMSATLWMHLFQLKVEHCAHDLLPSLRQPSPAPLPSHELQLHRPDLDVVQGGLAIDVLAEPVVPEQLHPRRPSNPTCYPHWTTLSLDMMSLSEPVKGIRIPQSGQNTELRSLHGLIYPRRAFNSGPVSLWPQWGQALSIKLKRLASRPQ